MHADAELFVDRVFELGENPLWDERRGRLYWTDIAAGELWTASENGEAARIYTGPKVGGFTFQVDGRLLLFREDDVALFDPDAAHSRGAGERDTATSILRHGDTNIERFNDVSATPDGSVLAGTIGAGDTSGGLYRLSRDRVLNELWLGTKVSNGMGFTVPANTLFWTDSSAKVIHRLPWPLDGAVRGDESAWYRAGADGSTPDGLTIDDAGHVYSSQWGGRCVLIFDGEGGPIARIPVEMENVTACIFGGADMRTLYITTHQGGIFRWTGDSAGRPEHRSQIALPL